jgi:murein DD-endopeptidase MepM/ murein hydrolase activator NlpD
VILRRSFLFGTLAFAAAPGCARAITSPRLSFSGSLKQGSLVVGVAEPGARIWVNRAPVLVAENGTFAFGFEYNQKTPAIVVAQFHDGSRETQSVAPVARTYEVQRINGLPEKFVSPPPDVQKRIDRENALIVEARKRDTTSTAFAEPFDWPTTGIVSGLFGSQRILNGEPKAPHFGVDIAAPEGRPIHAPADGTVALAEPDFYLTGGTTVLDHGHGVFTMYLHQSALDVKLNQAVKRGDVIGQVGKKGRATGPHLHWGMNWFQVKLDPSLSTRTPAPAKA